MQFIKDAQIKNLRELRTMHPQISFTANTPAELGWSVYTPPPYVPTQEELDRQAAYAALLADAENAKADVRLRAIAGRTPAQARAWVDSNVTNLAQAKEILGDLAAIATILVRRL
jgi:hypothetical protein